MRRPGAHLLVIIAAILIVGWPASASAQRPAATGQTTEAPTEQGMTEPQTPIPPLTDADRAAAFPDVDGHALPDNAVQAFVLVDQVEWQGGETGSGLTWDAKGWLGRDRDRLWFRTEGEAEGGSLGATEVHLFYGRAVARWWDVVVGVRQDVRPGPAQTWAAFGVQGLAPYWFEVEATGYVSDGGQTAARLEAEYELLFTNRLVLQPRVEVNLYGKTHEARGVGAGLSDVEAGLRMRYEFRREFAPYIGLEWSRPFGQTADFAAAAGLRFVAGLRLWY